MTSSSMTFLFKELSITVYFGKEAYSLYSWFIYVTVRNTDKAVESRKDCEVLPHELVYAASPSGLNNPHAQSIIYNFQSAYYYTNMGAT